MMPQTNLFLAAQDKILWPVLFLFLTVGCPKVFAEPITFLTHSVGEQTYIAETGELRGREHQGRRAFNIELVREMMDIVGHPREMEVLPFKRALLMLKSEPGYALFNVNRTAEREQEMKWVGPLQSSVTHFFENKNHPTGISKLDDAKKVDSICVLRGNVHNRFLTKRGFENIYPANSYANCVRMLEQGRVSLTLLSNLSSLTPNGQAPDDSLLRKTDVLLMKSQGFLALSKETPDSDVKEWQDALEQIKASGRYDELVNLYLITE
jgi:polar amino acid transport system substrate-binding protein